MNNLRKNFVKKFLIAMLAAVCCASLITGVLLNRRGGLTPDGVNKVFAEEVAAPLRAYTAIRVERKNDYQVIAGQTTARSLKNNVVVKGTTDPNQNFSTSYVLNNDEYVISVGGKTLGADEKVYNEDATEGATVGVVFAANETAVYPASFDVIAAPTFEGTTTLNVPDSITDDHTIETILKVISVTAADGTVIPNDLYKVNLVYNGDKATITITDPVGFAEPTPAENITVTPAPLLGVDLQVKADYKLNGTYYQDENGYDAFIQGDNQEKVLSKLDLIAIYENSRKTVALTFSNGYLTTPNITNSNLSVSWSAPSGNFKISFDYCGNNVELSLYFAEQSVHHIEVNETLFKTILDDVLTIYGYTLDSSLELNISDFVDSEKGNPFTIVTNSNTSRPASSQEIAFDGNFAPNASDIINGTNYTKTIKIVNKVNGEINTAAIPAKVTIDKIKLSAPDSVLLSGDIASQMMHHDFDYSGLEVTFNYSSGSEIKILLTDFFAKADKETVEKFLEVNIYSDLAGTKRESKITKNTKRVNAKFKYDSVSSNIKNRNNVPLLQDAIKVPAFDCSLENYKLGLTREFNAEELKYNKYDENGNLIGTYDMNVAVYSDKDCTTPMSEAFAKLEGNVVNFFAGGDFYIKVSLANEKLDEYDFEVVNNNDITRTDHDLVYHIKINKGMLSVALDDFEDGIRYGTPFTTTAKGTTLGGIEYTLENADSTDDPNKLPVPHKLVYVQDGKVINSDNTLGGAFDPDMFKTDGSFDEGKFNAYTAPTQLDAGTYQVYLFTKETGAYLSSQSSTAKTLEIGKKVITLDNTAAKEFTYTRTADYKAEDFVSSSVNLPYGHQINTVLGSKIYVGTTTTTEASTPYYVGAYNVTITVNAAYQKNYTLSEASDTEYSTNVNFTVKARTLSFTVNAAGWTYGDANPNPNASVDKSGNPDGADYFYAALENTDVVYYKGSVAEANEINDPFSTWAAGDYIAYYKAKDPKNAQYPDELKSGAECYNLPEGQKKFTVTAQPVEAPTVNNWGTSAATAVNLGFYGNEKTFSFSDWSSANNGKAYTTTLVYTDMTNTAHAAETLTDSNKKLSDAGTYVITFTRDPNYSWTHSTAAVSFYAKIEQSVVSDFALSDGVTYNGTSQTVNATFKIGDGETASWHKDGLKSDASILVFDGDITGSGYAAAGKTVTGNDTNGTFAVTYAGDYAVNVTINDTNNYKWADGAVKTATYTVAQAPFKISSADANIAFDEDADGQKHPVLTVDRTLEASGADDAVLTVVKYAITTKAGATVTDNKITAAGDYILTVIEIGGTAYKNYSLTDANAAISFEFTVESAGLDRFTGLSSNSEEFSGDNYKISSYIADFETKYKGRLVITVEGFTDNNPGLRNADTYYITIKLAPNYKWKGDDQSDIRLTFTITPLEVDFTWGDVNNFTYDGKTPHVPTITFNNNEDGAKAALTVTVTGVNATEGKAINAGDYTATFALDGDLQSNYSLPTDCTTAFKVKKQVLNTPNRTNSNALEFNNAEQTVGYTWTVNGNTMTSVSLNGKVTIANNGSTNYFGDDNTITADNATGVVTVKNAGEYSLSFTLDNETFKNYSWANGAQSVTARFTVAKKKVVAPALGAQRAIEWDNDAASRLVPNNLDGTINLGENWVVTYSTKYGKYESGFTGAITDEQVATAPGLAYFVVLTITNTDAYNYEWIDNADDKTHDSMDFLKEIGEYGQADNNYATKSLRMFLCYTVTQLQLQFDVSIEDYTFGDNGVADDFTVNNKFTNDGNLLVNNSNVIVFSQTTGDNLTADQLEGYKNHYETLVRLNPSVTVTFTDENGRNVTGENLVKGFPWNAGKYTAVITVDFDETDPSQKDYNDRTFTRNFTVLPRVVKIEWSGDEELTYNGAEQTRVATVTNVPKKNADDTAASFTLKVKGVTNVVLSNKVAAAQVITATAEGLSANYTLTGAKDTSSMLTIKPKTIVVKGKPVTGHVYGDDIKPGEKEFTYAAGTFCEDDKPEDYITVKIVNGSGAEIDKTAAVGSYFVKPVLNTSYATYANYVINEAAKGYQGAFDVVPRDITVKFSGATSVYGEAPANMSAFLYDKAAVGGKGLPSFATKETVLSLSVDVTNATDAGTYDISCTLQTEVAGNYNLTYTQTQNYEVTKAQITVDVNISIYYGEESPVVNSYKFNELGDAIYTFTAGAKNGETKDSIVADLTSTTCGYALKEGVTYTKFTSGVDTYLLTFNAGTLEHKNYTFIGGTDSKFTVQKLTVTVSAEHQEATYYTVPDALKAPIVTTTVESIYGGTVVLGDVNDIVTLKTLALSKNADGTLKTNGVKGYAEDGTVIGYDIQYTVNTLRIDNYTFINGPTVGKYTITPATLLDVKTDGYAGYSFDYDATPHSIIKIDGKEITDAKTLAKTVDTSDITVKFNDTAYTVIPTVTEKGTYTYTFTISAANHKDVTGTFTVTVNYGANGIKEGYTLFVGEDLAVKAENKPANLPTAWTYGDYDSVSHTIGYNADGNQKVKVPVGNFADATFTYTLTHGEYVATGNDLAELFADAWGTGKLTAGEYSVKIEIAATDNYEKYSEVWYFKVAKQQLTLNPSDDLKVIYGEAVPDYTKKAPVGLVKNGGKIDAIDDVVTYTFGSAYVAGYANGSVKNDGYLVYVTSVGTDNNLTREADGSYIYDAANYVVTFGTSTLVVGARKITVEIEDKDNFFNLVLRDGNEYKLDQKKEYTFKLISGNFADGDGDNNTQKVFVLTSEAFTSDTYKTNNVEKYPIYITAGERFAKETGSNNYVITVKGNYSGAEITDNIASDKAKAGVFTIKPAELSVAVSENPFTAQEGGTETDLTYDGTAKYYHEFIRSLPENVNPTFEYEYLDSENRTISAPSAVGSYTVIIKAKDTNYSIADAEKPFTIVKRTISVAESFENSKGAYSTVSANTYTFNGGNFVKTLTFGNYLDSEKVSFKTTVTATRDHTLPEYTLSAGAANGTNYVFSARNTGTYSVTVTLANTDGFDTNNYQFNANGADSVSFSFTIQKAMLNITVPEFNVQYGTPINSNDVKFLLEVAGNTASAELLEEEQAKDATYWQPKNNDKGVRYLTTYVPSTSVWGTKYQVYFDESCLTAPNFKINPVKKDNLTIIARDIEIIVKGYDDTGDNKNKLASCIYAGPSHNHNECLKSAFEGNRGEFLTVNYGENFTKPNGDNYNPMNGVKLEIQSSARAVQRLNMAARYEGEAKYSVTFKNVAGTIITNSTADDNCPKYAILQKDLFITVSGKEVGNFNGNTAVSFEVPYGTAVVLKNNLTVYYSGWAEGETNGVNPTSGDVTGFDYIGGDYTPWQGLAGQSFKLRLTHNLVYPNYKVNIVDSTMNIGSLILEADAENLTYAPDTDNYHGGEYGLTRNVKLNFKTTDGRPFDPGKGDFVSAAAFNYTPNYDKTPDKVGNYTATVTFNTNTAGGYNYKFKEGTGSTTQKNFDFSIDKLGISLSWTGGDSLSFEAVTDSTTKNVTNYNAQIMDFVSFINGTAAVSADYYAIDRNNTLNGFEFKSIKAAGVGRYVLTVSLNDAAKNNYKWLDGDEVITVITLIVAYDSSFVAIENFIVDDWTYNDVASVPSAELNPPVTGGTFVYRYAAAPEDIDTTNRVPAGVDGLTYTLTVPKNAGWYIARAEYVHSDFTANYAYYLFQIKKAKIDAPAFDPSGNTYTGSNITAKLTYNTQSVYVRSFGGNYVTNVDGATLSVVNNGNYVLTLALRDTDNYEWNEDSFNGNYKVVSGDNTAITLTWTIAGATGNTITWDTNDIVTEYGEDYGTIEATATYSSARVYFTAKLENETVAPLAGDGRWDVRRPSQYSEYGYWVMAYCPAADNGNYDEAVATKTLTINKATLTFNPTVTEIYGITVGGIQKTLSIDGYKNSLSGFKGGDTGATVNGTFSFTFIYNRNDDDVLDATPYNVRITVDGSGFVVGITSNNYNVKPLNEDNTATLIIAKRALTVIIGDSESIYNQDIVNNNTLSVVGESDFDTDVLGVTLSCTAHKGDNVGSNYKVTGTASNNNYAVSFVEGTHTIKPLLIKVEIETENGVFGGAQPSARVSKITTTNLAANIDLDVNLSFVIRYTGIAFDGTTLANVNDIPTHAGDYVVTVLSTGDENYVLDGSLVYSANVSVKRQEINADDIEIPSEAYTGEPIEPQVNVVSGVYEVAAHDPFINKGVYTVNLRLLDTNNYKWKSREEGVALREVTFEITAAANRFENEIEITGWIYGKYDATNNKPTVDVLHGGDTVVFEYSDSRDGVYTVYVPANREVGTYWVRARVPASENYSERISEPVSFEISKAPLDAPTLAATSVVFDKEAELSAEILGYNMTLMFAFDHVTLSGGVIKLRADNQVGSYVTKVTLTDGHNYRWADGTDMDNEGNALLTLTVTRKPIAKPTHNNRTLVVNGSILEYLPNGFDAEIMDITGNTAGYGGTFKAYVSLKDTENYMWEDGTDDTLPPFTWKIVGSNTVFIAVMCSMSGASAIAGTAAAVLYVKYRKKQNEQPIDDGTTPEGGDTPPEGDAGENETANEEQGEVNE